MGTVSNHQLSTFTTPVNGTSPIDANQVKGNDNSIKTAYNAHDADTTIHLQSGAVATRPAASTAGQTWLGENFDTALLCGTLMEAITYMKGEQDMVALYQKRFDDAMSLLKQLGDAKEKGDSYRDGLPKYKVV